MNSDSPSDPHFYRDLPPHESFDIVGDLEAFARLPDGWTIVIADIRNSTPAIAAGRYKDVNMLGAACIVAALNAVPEFDLPYVFGGDGAMLAVPESALPAVRDALLKTRALAAQSFDMELRVGAVGISVLRERGVDVSVARLAISPGNHLALFAGGGVDLADRLIKADEDGKAGYSLQIAADADPDLEGLSCRWEPMRATRGMMVCLLARVRGESDALAAPRYRDLVRSINRVLGNDPLAGTPVRAENMRFRWPPRGLATEAALTRGGKPRWRRYLEIWLERLIQLYLERFDRSAGGYNAPVYREELRANTDFRRFDGTLRLVVDCTPAERDEIEALLEARHAAGELDFGMHVADSALMTCLVFDLAKSRHLHFVDGADGGFAIAALGLKAQLAEHATNLRPLASRDGSA